jgi:hypothetical protein
MPVPKSVRLAARKGGDIGGSPGGDPLAAYAESVVENSKADKGLFLLEVKSATLKEHKTRGPYRSVTGLAADGTVYWAELPLDCQPEPGDSLTLRGEFKGRTFGSGKKPIHVISRAKVVSITEKPITAVKEEPAKVSEPVAEELQTTLESLVKAHGIGKILSVLGEIT